MARAFALACRRVRRRQLGQLREVPSAICPLPSGRLLGLPSARLSALRPAPCLPPSALPSGPPLCPALWPCPLP